MSRPLRGQWTLTRALDELLSGTPFTYTITNNGLIKVFARPLPIRPSETPAAQRGLAPLPPAAAPPMSSGQEAGIVVTGSRVESEAIKDIPPVSIYDRARLDTLGVVSTGELVANIPQMGRQTFNSESRGPNAVRGDVSSANLRGLGSGNTLVLLDGRRLVTHPATEVEDSVPLQAVNLNIIPANALARMEVLRESASAIYGSEATAGVLNFITDDKLVGWRLSARFGGSQGTGLRETDITAAYGFRSKDERTRITLSLDAYLLSGLPASQRSYAATDDLSSRVPARYASYFDNRSLLTPWTVGSVATPVTGLGPTFAAFYAQPCTFSGSRAAVPGSPGVCLNGGSSTLPSALRYDEAPLRTLTPRTSRISLLSNFSHDFGSVEFFGDALTYRSESISLRGGSTNLTTAPLIVGVDNPYNPFGSGPGRLPSYTGPAQPIEIIGLRVDDVGQRRIDVVSTADRILGGLRGRLGSWKWETASLYSWAYTDDRESNRVSNTALQAALLSSDPATAYNPFTGGNLQNPSLADPSLNPASVVDPLRITVRRRSATSLYLSDAKLSTPSLLQLRGQDLSLIVGAEFRRETYRDRRDPRVNGTINYTAPDGTITSDVLGTSPSADTYGSRNVASLYAEAALPLVTSQDDIPLVRKLELQGAFRFEHFSDIGMGVLRPELSLGWEVNDWLSFRLSHSQGFRAPNLETVNSRQIDRVQQQVTDYYLCALAQGVTSISAINRSGCGSFQYDVEDIRSGNRHLRPETTSSFSAGFVLRPARWLRLTFDYWRVMQRNIVGLFEDSDQLNLDAVRRLQDGSTNPAITRNAAGQPIAINNQFINLTRRLAEGLDADLALSIPVSSQDQLRLEADAVYNLRLYQAPSSESAELLAAGFSSTTGGSLIGLDGNPRLRVSASLMWQHDRLEASLSGNYVGHTVDTSALNYPVDHWLVANLACGYRLAPSAIGQTSVTVGINNLFNRKPPISDDVFGYNVTMFNDRGRFIYLKLTLATR